MRKEKLPVASFPHRAAQTGTERFALGRQAKSVFVLAVEMFFRRVEDATPYNNTIKLKDKMKHTVDSFRPCQKQLNHSVGLFLYKKAFLPFL